MKFLTLNTWHGLSGRGHIRFGELEVRSRRELRHRALQEEIRRISPDLIFFQELNPVGRLAKAWASELGYRQIHCRDNSGIKVGALGLPINLDSGLAILYPGDWRLLSSKALRLSGSDWSAQSDGFSFQFTENRWALIAHFRLPSDLEIVVVNTHLHHGAEVDESLRQASLENARALGATSSELNLLEMQLGAGEIRRQNEMATLMKALEQMPHVEGVLLAGDFNASPESRVVHSVLENEFLDLWQNLRPNDPGLTWDRETNEANHHLLKGFAARFQLSGLRQEFLPIEAMIRAREELPRRIDYAFWKSSGQNIHPRRISFAMNEVRAEFGLLPSDHFGLLVDFSDGEF